jgi:Flp pilus assembly protein CpaB
LLCAAFAAAVYQITPPSSASAAAVVAAVDLPAGALVNATDLRLASIPADVIPERAASQVEAVAGQRLAGPLRRGEVITDAAFVGPGILAGAPPGTVAVPLRVSDPGSLQLVRTGQGVDIVLSEEANREGPRSTTLATSVTVLWTGNGGSSGTAWPGLTKDSEGLLVVAANPEESARLAGASTRGKIFFVLVEPGPR